MNPGVLQSMGLQRVGHNLAYEQQICLRLINLGVNLVIDVSQASPLAQQPRIRLQCRRHRSRGFRFNPWVGKIPWRMAWQPTSVFCLGNPMDRGTWRATVYAVAESETTKQLNNNNNNLDRGQLSTSREIIPSS